MKKKKEKIHSTSQGINEDLHGYAYLFHVNSMPGYFENQDTSQANGKKQTLHHSKRQRNNDNRILDIMWSNIREIKHFINK